MAHVAATILDGKATAAAIKSELATRVAALKAKGIHPGLGTILVGDDPGSHSYVGGKHRDCAEVGIASIRRDLPDDASQADVERAVAELNADPACTGYIVQLPLPKGLDPHRVLALMDPDKDADGLHPMNLGRLVLGEAAPLPCTPRGIVELLRRYDVPIAGAEVVVVGRGVTVGRPLGLLLTRRSENATVTLCHTGTRDLRSHLARADIIVAAAGVPGSGHGRLDSSRCCGAGRGDHPNRSRIGGRCVARGLRGCWAPCADAWRHGADDQGDAPGQRRRARRGTGRGSGGLTVTADEPQAVRLDGEGNPIDDQPLIERTIDQWPLALVLLGMASGWSSCPSTTSGSDRSCSAPLWSSALRCARCYPTTERGCWRSAADRLTSSRCTGWASR